VERNEEVESLEETRPHYLITTSLQLPLFQLLLSVCASCTGCLQPSDLSYTRWLGPSFINRLGLFPFPSERGEEARV